MEYGLQMYSVRDITPTDLDGALKQVAEIGYKYVEFAGFFGHSAEDVKAMLDKYGLICSGTHTGLADLKGDFDELIAYHKTIGNKNIIIPGAPIATKADVDALIDFVNEMQPKLAKEGITLGFHNHHREFLPNQDGVITYDELEKRTTINLQIDTYWAFVGGRDPIEMMERLKDRVKIIHIKDGSKDGKGKPLGLGEAPADKVYKKAKELGMLMVVESETCDPDGMTEADICFKFLKAQE